MQAEILTVLPPTIKECLQALPDEIVRYVEEIRIRISRPLEVIAGGKPYYPEQRGESYIVQESDAHFLLNQLSEYSLYAFEEELRKGFITIRGGHRVGLAGKVLLERGDVQTLRPISSFNIRIARQKIGAAARLIGDLYEPKERRWLSTLFVGAPQTGKTTVLRDLTRLMSQGVPNRQIEAIKVGIVDERSEIAASIAGVPQHELGSRVDVLDGCPKAEGMMMMIRSMSPEVLVVDEIGRAEDTRAIIEALHAGVNVIATAHGHSFEEVAQRPALKELFAAGAFGRVVELGRLPHPGSISRIRLPRQLKVAMGK
ncbi:stage III sporulation protein AA [Shouchella shacheensis]|uniref:stage III sporulation protein AA n=1 Tax=Shouchella shacheensis TaxID=1649580 RepID=UPI00074053C2|nr:stage III sporulation protein AA [Shouchella shacheensis]